MYRRINQGYHDLTWHVPKTCVHFVESAWCLQQIISENQESEHSETAAVINFGHFQHFFHCQEKKKEPKIKDLFVSSKIMTHSDPHKSLAVGTSGYELGAVTSHSDEPKDNPIHTLQVALITDYKPRTSSFGPKMRSHYKQCLDSCGGQ